MKSIHNKQILIVQEIDDEYSTGFRARAAGAGA